MKASTGVSVAILLSLVMALALWTCCRAKPNDQATFEITDHDHGTTTGAAK